MSLPSLAVSSQRASSMARSKSWSRVLVASSVRVAGECHHSLSSFSSCWRTTSNQRSPPSGCAESAERWPHSRTLRVSSSGPVWLAGSTLRHWPLTRTSLGSLLPKPSLRMLRQTALK